MSDFDSSLPIRSEADGTDARVQVKVVDSQNPNTQQMEVDADKNAHVEIHGNRADDASDIPMQLSEEGRVNPRGDYEVDENSKPASVAIIGHSRNASKTEAHQTKRISAIDSSEDSDVTALDVAIRDESGNAFTSDNPLPVFVAEHEGEEIIDYQTSASIGSDASVTHDYTVSASRTFIGDDVWATGSGKIKVEVSVETGIASGTFISKWVGFSSTANPNVAIPMSKKLKVSAGVRIRLTITNRDNQSQDLYSTLIGIEKV